MGGPMLAHRIRNEGADQAPPIIYIHGAMGSNLYWLPLSRGLAEKLPGRAGYLIDLPGHGESDEPGCDNISDYAQALLDFMDEKVIGCAVLVGHSMGGAISQYVALHHPDRVEKLVLLATGAKLGVSQQLLDALASDFETAVTMVKDFAFGPGVPKEVYQPAIDQMKQVGSKTAVNDFVACNAFDVRDTVSAIKAPALVCCGDKDMLTSSKNNKLLAEALGCKYVEFPNAGHMISIERTTELTEILAPFLHD